MTSHDESWMVGRFLQKGLLEKVTPQLEKVVATKLEAAVTRQLQTQLGMVLRPALQVISRPAFSVSVTHVGYWVEP